MTNHDADRLIDDMLDAYIEWREACDAVAAAYARWAREVPGGGHDVFHDYRQALDSEELAAERYADHTRRVTQNHLSGRGSVLIDALERR
jgi:hypothetical protein